MVTDHGSEGAGRLEAYYGHISQLTSEALVGKPKKQNRALHALVQELKGSEFFDPGLVALERGMDLIRKEANPAELRSKLEKFSGLLAIIANDTHDKGGKSARINPTIAKILASVVKHDEEIKQSPRHKYLREQIFGTPSFDQAYHTMVGTAISCNQKVKRGSNNINISFTDPNESPEVKQKRDRENEQRAQWWFAFKDSANAYKDDRDNVALKDKVISRLKEEPSQSVKEVAPYVDRKFSDVSFRDLEKMQQPLSKTDTVKWVEYLSGVFGAPAASGDWLKNNGQILAAVFLFTFKSQSGTDQLPQLENSPFISRAQDFQGNLLRLIVDENNPEIAGKVKKLLEVMPDLAADFMVNNLVKLTVYPAEDGNEMKEQDYEKENDFSTDALRWWGKKNQDGPFVYTDQAGFEYLEQVLLPRFKQRVLEFGASEKFRPMISLMESKLAERPFEESYMRMIREFFHASCGEEFLRKLDSKADEIREVKQKAWEVLEEEGMHFLPMTDGLNTVAFSEGSVPDILGLESISLNTAGETDNWRTNVLFRMKKSPRVILGSLDSEGKLNLKADVEKEIPGLYLMLNHISVLTFRDLTVQVEKSKRQKSGSNISSGEKNGSTHENENSGESKENQDKIRYRNLPRLQSDRQLISEVSKGGNFTPRPIEMHTTWVAGGRDYETAINLYNEAKENGASEEVLQSAASLLESMRANSKKASEEKVGKWPNRYESSRVHVVDPITHQQRDLVTWVVQHISPKPTAEELTSQVKMYERYYRNSSSLASLEQMRPWFVGLG